MNKKKILNDPVYGFIHIKSDLVFDIIEDPIFQRLRRIKQLGLTDYVYPGALHTRFHHALGAMHLMGLALDSLRMKNVPINDDEYEATLIAILLHDIGHGPFSHALEFSLLKGIQHESLSLLLMQHLNQQHNNQLSLAIKIFQDSYHRGFFHSLISSQLDIDRLDYLKRDSFFTAVPEGNISLERIILMLNVVNDELVVEEKAIYSIENFLNARRMMYWQVYLHKTSVGAEKILISLINRAKEIAQSGQNVSTSAALEQFLTQNYTLEDFQNRPSLLAQYAKLDDYDIWGAIKCWSTHGDKILRLLANMMLERKLFKISLRNEPLKKSEITAVRESIASVLNIRQADSRYFYAHGEVSNAAYASGKKNINILKKDGSIVELSEAADLPNIKAMSKIVKKYYLSWPKNVNL